MTEPKTHKRLDAQRQIRMAKSLSASEAIGTIEKGSDTYILTYGQFSLIDALVTILDQTGPARVAISTWTAADAHLQRSAELVESAAIIDLRLIVDRSFETRQPQYCYHMRQLFGPQCIRAFRTHAKFMLDRADEAKGRIETEGAVVRDMKGSVIPHPAIAIEKDATKIAADLLAKHSNRAPARSG